MSDSESKIARTYWEAFPIINGYKQKRKTMKYIYLLISLCVTPLSSFAATQSATGHIGDIRYHTAEQTLNVPWRKVVWFKLVDSDNNICTSNNISVATTDNETAISMILAAKMANKEVMVTIDDAIKYPAGTTYCSLQYITIK